MPYVNRVMDIELMYDRVEVVGIRVHIVAVEGLRRAPMAAAIVRDAPIATRRQEVHLIFPGVGVERPAMAEDYGLSLAPIFDVNVRPVVHLHHVAHRRTSHRKERTAKLPKVHGARQAQRAKTTSRF